MPSLRQKQKRDPQSRRAESDKDGGSKDERDGELLALNEAVRALQRSAIQSRGQTNDIEELRRWNSLFRNELDDMKSQVRQLAKQLVECTTELKRCVEYDQVELATVGTEYTDNGRSSAFVDLETTQRTKEPSDEPLELIDMDLEPVPESPTALTPVPRGSVISTKSDPSTGCLLTVYNAEVRHATLIYKLSPSIWDATLLIGIPNLGIGVSWSLMLCLLFNLMLLALFIAVIGCVVPDFSDSNIDEIHFWRATIAHDISLRNPITGESLASGVCDKKLSTPFSNVYILNLMALDDYLVGFGNDKVCTGGVMCVLALALWFMTLMHEVRHIYQFVVALHCLPTSSVFGIEAMGERVRLQGTSACTKAMMFVLAAVRLGTVAMLAFYGVRLLVSEISVENILLDAVSLGFILQVDELIFCSLAPRVAQTLVDRMLPLPLHRSALVVEFLLLPFLMAVPLVLVTVFVLSPNISMLRDSRDALCGGVGSSLNFVVAVDAIGIPWASSTPTSDTAASFAGHAVLEAKEHGFRHVMLQPNQRDNSGLFMHVSTGDVLQAFRSTLSEFREPSDWEMIDVANLARVDGWNELDVLGPDGHDFGDQQGTVYNNYLHYLLGTPATASATCAQVPMSRCFTHGGTRDAVVMRQLCPSRCGCGEPTSGTVSSFYTSGLAFGISGCARWNRRKQRFHTALAVLPCIDTIARDMFELWAFGLGDFLLKGHNDSLRNSILASFDQGGCPQAAKFNLGVGIKICEETSMPAICPESCGCNSSRPFMFHYSRVLDFCPHVCKVGATFCFTAVRNYTLHTVGGDYGPLVGYACIFPFVYKKQTYTSCSSVDWPVHWCYVTIRDGVGLHWGDCPHSCSNAAATGAIVSR